MGHKNWVYNPLTTSLMWPKYLYDKISTYGTTIDSPKVGGLVRKCFQLLHYLSIGTIPILRQQRDWAGVVRKLTFFADFQFYLFWRRLGGWVRRSQKMCRRNVGVVPLAPFPGVSTELKFYVLSFSLNEAQCNGLNISRWEFLFSFTTFSRDSYL